MKKTVLFSYFLLISAICFALPDIKLYFDSDFIVEIKGDNIFSEDGDVIMAIRDGKLYESEGSESIGTISEDKDTVFLYINEGDSAEAFEFEKLTGLLHKTTHYIKDIVDSYEIHGYENKKTIRTTYYNVDNITTGYTQYSYDKKTGVQIKSANYNAENQLINLTEYDNKTGRRIKESRYDNGILKTQTSYDKNTEMTTERLVYTSKSKKPAKWTFLKFDEDGKCALSDNYWLSSKMCWYDSLEDYAEKSKDNPIDWNESYSARIRKYNFTKNTDGYSVIENLKNKHYLSSSSFALCKENSNICYCFDTTENDEIDISSCYEIELIKKKRNYSTMNKSGNGKGPFGFDIGMTYEQIKNACDGTELEHISDDRYYVKPKKSHPLFEKYIVWISDEYGLYYIKAISHDIYSLDYGTEPKREFEKILASLEKKYGKFSKIDTVKSDYYFKDERDFMMSLRDGARTYRAEWCATKDNYRDYDGLIEILIGINASSVSKAYIWLEYEFLNHDDAKDALNDVL